MEFAVRRGYTTASLHSAVARVARCDQRFYAFVHTVYIGCFWSCCHASAVAATAMHQAYNVIYTYTMPHLYGACGCVRQCIRRETK